MSGTTDSGFGTDQRFARSKTISKRASKMAKSEANSPKVSFRNLGTSGKRKTGEIPPVLSRLTFHSTVEKAITASYMNCSNMNQSTTVGHLSQ